MSTGNRPSPSIHCTVAAMLVMCATSLQHACTARADPPKSPPPIRCLVFSPDSQLLAASASANVSRGELAVWEVPQLRLRWRHSEEVGFPRVAFSPDGTTLALSRFAPETKLFSVVDGKQLRELKGHADHARCAIYTRDGTKIVTGSYDHTIKVWDAASGKLLRTLEGQLGPVYHLCISADSRVLVSADAKRRQAHVWDFQNGKLIHSFTNLGSLVPHVSCTPDGSLLTVCSWSGQLSMFDIHTRQLERRIQDIGGVHWGEFSHDLRWLAVAANGPTAYIFPGVVVADDATRRAIADLVEQWRDDSYEVRQRASEQIIAFGGTAHAQLNEATSSPVAEVRLRARQLLRRLSRPDSAIKLPPHKHDLECVSFSPDGKWLASGDAGGMIRIWQTSDWKLAKSFSIFTDNASP